MRVVKLAGGVLLTLGSLATTRAQPQATVPKASVTLANEPWILGFDVKDFSVKTNELQPDGRAYLRAENQKANIGLSVYLEKVEGQATAAGCAENQKRHLNEKADYKPEEIENRKYDVMAILEFTIPEFDSAPIQLRNLFACIPKDDVYVDIHLAKILFKPEDEALFHAVLTSVQFFPKSSPAAK
jgi:hypothetical protein